MDVMTASGAGIEQAPTEFHSALGSVVVQNYTPHAITLYVGDLVLFEIPSHGCARCEEDRTVIDEVGINGERYPICRTTYGAVYGLPAPRAGVKYIVSHPVALWAKVHDAERHDLLVVDDAVRDEHGQVIGCRALSHL
jgi:hypothetical protein